MAKKKSAKEPEDPLVAINRLFDNLQKWLDSLSEHDRNNFKVLINLPSADKLIADMPEGEYKNQAIFARAIVKGTK